MLNINTQPHKMHKGVCTKPHKRANRWVRERQRERERVGGGGGGGEQNQTDTK